MTSLFVRTVLALTALWLCMALAEWRWGNPFFGALVYLTIYVVIMALVTDGSDNGGFMEVSSYRMFSRMRLYSRVALELGMMMMFCHVLITQAAMPMLYKYLLMLGWVVVLHVSGGLYSRYAVRRWKGKALAEFVAGAVTWVLGDIFMLNASSALWSLVWTTVWACGIVLIYFSLEGFSRDFAAVGAIAGDDCDRRTLDSTNRRLQQRSSLVAAGVTLLVMVLWTFRGTAALASQNTPRVLHITMLQLPILFMLVAVVYAVRQPFDSRNREKLMLYIESKTDNERVRTSLRHQLVRGHRVSFWARLLCWVAMPFLRHKVSGRENLRQGDYPSVLVCNHGFLYGPIVAALFLPTYFRPWIHDRMLREDLAEREISMSFPWARRVLGKRLGGAVIRLAAKLTTGLLLSFRPIPVVRGATRGAMTTFDESLAALAEGDNLLIFAEKPKRLNTGDNPDLRNLYTGFAHLGKLYHDATGRQLLFYPVYARHDRRTISIGEPVQYDPTLASRDAKQAVAEELQHRMELLAH